VTINKFLKNGVVAAIITISGGAVMPSHAFAEYSCSSSDPVCEATGQLTDVYLEDPEFPQGTNGEEFAWSNDVGGNHALLALGVHTITWTLKENANDTVAHTETQTITVVDTTPPYFQYGSELLIHAHGVYTTITLDMFSDIIEVFDNVDEDVEFTLLQEYRLTSGYNEITLVATDDSGNTSEETIGVGINPLVSFGDDQVALIGNIVEIPFFFTGESYQPTLVVLEFSGSVIDKGFSPAPDDTIFQMPAPNTLGGMLSFDITTETELDSSDTLIVTFTQYDEDHNSYNNANKPVDANDQLVITFTDQNVAPSVELTANLASGDICAIVPQSKSASQSKSARIGCGTTSLTGTVFEKDSTSNVTIEANVTDINNDDITFEWTVAGIERADYAVHNGTLQFSPSDATANIVTAHVIATEVGTDELFQASADIEIVLTGDTPPLNGDDTDGDGIPDSTEGLDDTDGDGIPDYLDDINANRNVLAIGADNDPMQTKPGLTLKLGLTKRAADGFGAADASVSEENLQTNGDDGAAPTSNNTVDEYSTPISPIVDFEVTGLAEGESIPVVIPLPNGSSLPRDAVYRKYTAESGWKNFVSDANNNLSSASRDISELCPAADDDTSYFHGLNAGHQCVRITIEDGGPNDADNTINGTIVDPGVITVLAPPATPTTPAPEPITTTTTTTTTTSSGGGSTGLLTLLLLPLIFFRKIKAKK